METEKSRILKECKNLLRQVNCEAVVDTKDDTLHDILFKSHVKKKMLLSWVIQQLYSSECCASNSFEDLMLLFISKQHLPNFLSGKMVLQDQFKVWKLIMNVLYQRHRRKSCSSTIDIEKDFESGVILDKYESVWSEKLEPNLNYVGLVSGKENKFTADELHSMLKTAKSDYIQISSSQATPVSTININTSTDSHAMLLETLHNSDQKLNNLINTDFELLKPTLPLHQLEASVKYQQFSRPMLNDTKNKLENLKENIGMFEKLIYGLEDLQQTAET